MSQEWIVMIVAIGASMVVVCIVSAAVVAVTKVTSRERTKREIMAYVAEGTISPKDAAALIELSEQAEMRKKILADAAWDFNSDSYRKTLDKVFAARAQEPAAGEEPAPGARPQPAAAAE